MPPRKPEISPSQENLFRIENEEIIPSALISQESKQIQLQFAYEALDLYAQENSKREGFMVVQAKRIGHKILEGHHPSEELIIKYEQSRHTTQRKADKLSRQAKMLFAKTINIDTEETVTIDDADPRRPAHTYVQSVDPARHRELEWRYKRFLQMYAGAANQKPRDEVRNGKAPICIPDYSKVDQIYDLILYGEEFRKPQTPERAVYKTYAPKERLQFDSAPDLVTTKSLIRDVLAIFGMRYGRMMTRERFANIMLNDATKDFNTKHIKLPRRKEGETLGIYCRHLPPDSLHAYAKRLYSEAIGVTAMREALTEGKSPLPKEKIDEIAKKYWDNFWITYQPFDADTNQNRVEYKEQLEEELKAIKHPTRTRKKPKSSVRVHRNQRELIEEIEWNLPRFT